MAASSAALRVRRLLEGSPFMTTLGVRLFRAVPGQVIIGMPFEPKRMGQQNGFVHAGVQTSVMDASCGFAAYSIFKEDERVLSTEFSTHLLRPAAGKYCLAVGEILKPGRTLSVTDARFGMFESEPEIFDRIRSISDGKEGRLAAEALIDRPTSTFRGTMIRLEGGG